MRKVELKIVALANSEVQPNSFVVVLKEASGNRRLPVVIGAFEAQSIALALENIPTNRPMTHDLFKNTLSALGISLREVIISNLRFGVFFATLVCEQTDGKVFELDSRTSDAIALAVRFECPIFVQDFIMDEAGVTIDRPAASGPSSPPPRKKELSSYSDMELEALLEEALASEEYEQAARIRDEIRRREG
ncbi:MAG: bifunctional nuclease family protein [Phaeodactylibacter sp.]|nr:bifunctional nuclease family protein [Phaeodactylibacter sp.]MCB9293936.1 bifunctional nuclease family protein [Lewinellaceae bacterium]